MPKDIIKKIQAFGLRGILNYLVSRPAQYRLYRRLSENYSRTSASKPATGITVIAPLCQTASLVKTMRDFVKSLHAAKIPYQTFNCGTETRCPDESFVPLMTNQQDFCLNKYQHIIGMLGTCKLPQMKGVQVHHVIFWEFESGITSGYPHLLSPDFNIIAMSLFNYAYFKTTFKGISNVFYIRYPFLLPSSLPNKDAKLQTRQRYNLSPNDFVVFFNVGIGSNRKNPEGCIIAFAKAFKGIANAKLVLKTMHTKKFPTLFNSLKELAREMGIAGQFIVIEDYLPESEIYALTNACDVYLSLHRGEGFGLGIAEAMSLGKPVIVTDYSAPREFCPPDCAIPIPYTMVIPTLSAFDKTVYRDVKEWAEPDIEKASEALRTLYSDPDLRQRIGKKAQEFITSYFSTEEFKKSVFDFFNASAAVAQGE